MAVKNLIFLQLIVEDGKKAKIDYIGKSMPYKLFQVLLKLNLAMYPSKHWGTQFCLFLDCFGKPQNKAMLPAKSGWTLGGAHIHFV